MPGEKRNISDMTQEEIVAEIAELGLEEEGEELKGEEGEEGKDDPYAFIKENTPYDSAEALVEGHKNIQAFATKVHQRNIELEEKLATQGKKGQEGTDDIENISELESEGMSPQELKKIVDLEINKRMDEERKKLSEEKEEDDKQKEKDDFNNKLESHYQEAITLEKWNENQDKVHGIIRRYPEIVEVYTGNPYKFALQLASNPELMKVYNQHPNLFNLADGGMEIAKRFLNPTEKKNELKVNKESEYEEEGEIDEQAELLKATVLTPSTNSDKTISIEDLSREEVYEAAGYKPD